MTAVARALPARDNADITLRRADLADRERVYEYNFAAATTVSYSDHVRWFSTRIIDPSSPIWIVEQYGEPVGTVRIDARDGVNARISIALASNARGHGIGRKAVELACTKWCGAVVAESPESNPRCRACFTACGFSKIGRRDAVDVYLWSP